MLVEFVMIVARNEYSVITVSLSEHVNQNMCFFSCEEPHINYNYQKQKKILSNKANNYSSQSLKFSKTMVYELNFLVYQKFTFSQAL